VANLTRDSSSTRGAVAGLLAAALFGASTPLAKALLAEVTPQVLAGLLYLGAGAALMLARVLSPKHAAGEARLRRSDAPTMAAIVLTGGVVGPVLMLFGLERVDALVGSLLLNLEGVLTIALAVVFFGEHLGRNAALSALAILSGAAILKPKPRARTGVCLPRWRIKSRTGTPKPRRRRACAA
jgi:drug/metabolite transporter (DMT)-like permease